MTPKHSQLDFSFLLPRKQITACFDQEAITSEAGLLALKAFEHKLGYLDKINAVIVDPRAPTLITHEQQTLVAQRLFGMVAGYPDCNDHERLRHDPTFRVITEPRDLEAPLSSQPTLCRLENRVTAGDLQKLDQLLIDSYLEARPSRSVVLDLDTTDDPCHGKQQLSLFNQHYQNTIYLPLLIFEAHSGHLLCASLRLGQKPSGEEVVESLKPVVDRIKAAKRRATLRLRADAEFGSADLYQYLEEENLLYAIGGTAWPPLKAKADKLLQKTRRRYQSTGQPQCGFGSTFYRADSWNRRRRVVFKVEVNAQGTHTRFLVTNLPDPPEKVFAFYQDRGNCENHIKELKNGLAADRLSCHAFLANCFRFLLHGLAYNLYNRFQKALRSTPLANAQIDTLRVQLFKVGARVNLTTRRVWFHLSSNWPYTDLLQQVCHAVALFEPT